ncbi:MAG: hypothetical protein NTV74_06715 [Euryarchaeota archaeon]|nr:hypothetical protein [Euryarchaeota archaeon]
MLIVPMVFLSVFSNVSFSKRININELNSGSFSWRDINGTDFTTPVKNQEFCKSDASFALIACLETKVQYEIGYPFYCDLSEAHLFFNCNGTCDKGVNISVCADYLKNYGVPDEGCFPYPERYCSVPDYTNISDWSDRAGKIHDWGWVKNDVESIKKAIVQYGPVCALINYSSSFVNYKGGIYEPNGRTRGAQWVSIFGFDDDPGFWICKNSWGEEWGEYGWFKIPYDPGMITSGRHLQSSNIPNDCTGVIFLNGTTGNLTSDVPIVKIYQPALGFIYSNHFRDKKRIFKSNFFTERLIYTNYNGLLNKVFKKRFVDIRTPWVINSCLIEVCALRYTGNASVYIDDVLKYNFTKTTFYTSFKVDTLGLHTLKVIAYNKNGDKSVDIRDFLVTT